MELTLSSIKLEAKYHEHETQSDQNCYTLCHTAIGSYINMVTIGSNCCSDGFIVTSAIVVGNIISVVIIILLEVSSSSSVPGTVLLNTVTVVTIDI